MFLVSLRREACGCLAPTRPEIESTPHATEVEVLATEPPGSRADMILMRRKKTAEAGTLVISLQF